MSEMEIESRPTDPTNPVDETSQAETAPTDPTQVETPVMAGTPPHASEMEPNSTYHDKFPCR